MSRDERPSGDMQMTARGRIPVGHRPLGAATRVRQL